MTELSGQLAQLEVLLAPSPFWSGQHSPCPGCEVPPDHTRVRPVQDKGWGKLALQMITSGLKGVDQHIALVVERSD
jgi:hypothetical protein